MYSAGLGSELQGLVLCMYVCVCAAAAAAAAVINFFPFVSALYAFLTVHVHMRGVCMH